MNNMNGIYSFYQRQNVRLLLALLFGALGPFSFSPYDYWPLALLSLMGLLGLSLQRRTNQAAAIGFAWGVAFFGFGIHWIYVSIATFGGMPTPINVFLVVLLALYLALYPSLFSLLVNYFTPESPGIRLILLAPVIWQITEFLRGWILTGFPWLQFGYTQINGPLKMLAPFGGVEFITLVLVLISGLGVYALIKKQLLPACVALILLFLPLTLNDCKSYKLEPNRSVNVALVQGNIPQSLKWEPEELRDILSLYQEYSKPDLKHRRIIIWPESAIPDEENQQQLFLNNFNKKLRESGSALITGIVDTPEKNPQSPFYNAVIVLGNAPDYHSDNANRYRKYHLVPFGEYVPFQKFLRPIAPLFDLPMSSFSQGNYQQIPLNAGGYQFTTAICYEIILGSQVRDNFRPDTDFILTLSNDAWFGKSIGPWQHFQMARMRALELGRPLLRATNNGITAVIDARGNIQKMLPQFSRQVLEARVTPTRGLTPYARWGNTIIWSITLLLATLACVIQLIIRAKMKNKRRKGK